ncbi:MAG: tetratricopeptide repeat protein [Calditrichaeota bacterium]|nr:tetratricopeptide repeat protein [Calditrichota bacterium]
MSIILQDWIDYFSGWLPLGIYLLPLIGSAFSFVWWVVWKGTGFYTRRKFWRVLIMGWMLVFTLYSALWSLNASPPIPTRIVLVYASQSEDNWRCDLTASALNSRLNVSRRPFVVNVGQVNDMRNIAFANFRQFETFLVRSRIRYLIEIDTNPNRDGTVVKISRRKGNLFEGKVLLHSPDVSVAAAAIWAAQESVKILGDDKRIENYPGLPPAQSEARFKALSEAKFALARSETSAVSKIIDLTEQDTLWRQPRLELAQYWLLNGPGQHKEDIERHLHAILRSNPQDSDALVLLGWFYLEFRDWEKAESSLKLALNYNPDDPRSYYYLSRLMPARLKDLKWKSKPALLKRALQLDPAYENARLALAQHYRRIDRRSLAISLLNQGLDINPHSTDLLLTRAAMELESNRVKAAEATCLQILQRDSTHAKAYFNYGLALLGLKRFDEAIRVFETSFNNGGTIENLYYLGVANQRRGDYARAIYWFQRRFAAMENSTDKVAVSARERVKLLKTWLIDSTQAGMSDIKDSLEAQF